MTIYYQGIPGSFSHGAAKEYFLGEGEYDGCKNFGEVFAALTKPHSYAVLPIENTIAGSIHENYDRLAKHQHFHITGEIRKHIEHNLLTLPGATISCVRKVFSHYKALEQCQNFFDTHPHIEEVIYFDTAGAAEFVQQEGRVEYAAIASKDAATLYHLTILKKNIEDNPHNITRFIVVTGEKIDMPEANKCSLVFTTPHEPHALQKVLNIFALTNCNLTKLESRPVIGKPFEYVFYVDFEFETGSRKEIDIMLAFLQKQQPYFHVLGMYQASK